MKWAFYVVVFIYMFYRAVYGAKIKEINSLSVDPVEYDKHADYLLPGSVKTIACKYTNKNQQVEWIDPSGNPVSHMKTSRIFAQKHLSQMLHGDRIQSLLLAFTDAWVEDSGVYECQSGDLSEKISICVIDPLSFVDTPSEVSVDEGRSYTLTCEARGRPEPRLVWTRHGEVIADDNSTKYKVMTKFNNQGFQGLLTVLSVEASDAGDYVCEAIQEHSDMEDCSVTKSWNITMHVNYAPVFVDGNETILFAKNNESVDFECEPSAYPAPTYRWFYELQEQTLLNYPPEKVILSDDNTKSKVTITANALTFGVKYVCEAKNNFGEASKTFSVLKMEKPRKPSEVIVQNVTDIQVDLFVAWPVEIAFPIDEIEIQYLKEEGKKKMPREIDWKKSKLMKYGIEEMDKGSAKVSVGVLMPETDYWIRLRAVNGLGYAPWSNPIFASTTAEEEEAEEITKESSNDNDNDPEPAEGAVDAQVNSMFYGIFFGGGILVIAFACMVFMRLV